MDNPISNFIDNPNNPFEKAKDFVGNEVGKIMQTSGAQRVMKDAEPVTSLLSKAAIPYREVVAPAISAALLEMNSHYRDQNKTLNFQQQLTRAFGLAKQQVGKDEWRRAISPGRAMVGLLGDWNFVGEQGTDKIDWSNASEVDKYFTSGSAQFWSGLADLGFNLTDPVALAGGAGSRALRRTLITRPLTGRAASKTVGTLVNEVDNAVVNPEATTGIARMMKFIADNPENIRAIAAHGFVAGSANPMRLAIALGDSYKMGGNQALGTAIKAALGHKDSIEAIRTQYKTVFDAVTENAGLNDVRRQELEDLKNFKKSTPDMTKEQVSQNLEDQARIKEAIAQADKEAEQLYAKQNSLEYLSLEDPAILNTWSKYNFIENWRAIVAKASSEGIFFEVNPNRKLKTARAIAQHAGIKTPVARTLMWFSPNQQLREHPAGVAYLGGVAGEQSGKEFDARVATLGRIAGMSKEEMNSLSRQYARATTKSERYRMLDELRYRGFELLVQKNYFKDGTKLENLNDVQREALNTFVSGMSEATRGAQTRSVASLLEKQYTVTDHTNGDLVAASHIKKLVDDMAHDYAISQQRDKVLPSDEEYVKAVLARNQASETQVPNVHFSVDMNYIDNVISENPGLLKSVIDGILEEGHTAKDVRKTLDEARKSAEMGGNSMHVSLSDVAKPMLKTTKDMSIEGLDAFYTYIWKPATLLSLKYTTRNVAEGWLRYIACMMDFNSNYNYSWTQMFRSSHDPGSVARTFRNRGYRQQSKENRKKYDQTYSTLAQKEGLVKKEMAYPTASAKQLANSVKDKIMTEADRLALESSDGMSLAMYIAKMGTNRTKRHTLTGVPGEKEAVDFIKNKLVPVMDNKDQDYGTELANKMIGLLADGKYDEAHVLAKNAHSADAIEALGLFRDKISALAEEAKNHSAPGAKSLEYSLDQIQFGLERLGVHINRTIGLLDERGKLIGELSNVGGKAGVRTRSFEKADNFQIYPGVKIDEAFAGEAGEMLRMATSSRASSTRVLADDRNVTGFGLMSLGSAHRPVEPSNLLWANAHADYVNNIIMKDAAMRHMVEGLANDLPIEDVIAETKKWIHSSDPEAIQWKREVKGNLMGFEKALHSDFSYEREVDLLSLQVLENLPPLASKDGNRYKGLYEAALRGFTPTDSQQIHMNDRYPVNADQEIHGKTLTTLMKNATATTFHLIGTMPEDHLARHPFFNMVYENEALRLAKRYEKEARSIPGATEESVTQYIAENKDRIANAALQRAYKELMARLYSVERHTMPSRFLRFVTPFYMAQQNSSRFWLGTSLRNPDVAYHLAKLYNAPFRAGYVQDDQGNVVSESNPWGKATNKQNIVFHSDNALLSQVMGGNVIKINPTSFDVITQGQLPLVPTFGAPVGEAITKESLKFAAKHTELDSFLKNNYNTNLDEVAAKYILPFYEKDEGQSVASSVVSSAVPFNSATISFLAVAYGMTGHLPVLEQLAPQIQNRYESHYKAARQRITEELLLSPDPLRSENIAKEAASIAIRSLTVEGFSSFVGPVAAFKMDDATLMRLKQDSARFTKAAGGDSALGSVNMVKSLEAQGYTWASSMVSALRTSSADNPYGFYSNIETAKGIQANSEALSMIDQYYTDNPLVGSMFNIVGNDATYSPIADDIMFSTKINGKPLKSKNMTPAEQDKKAQYNMAWATFYDNVAYIESAAEQKGFKKGTPQYDNLVTPWKNNLIDVIKQKFPQWASRDEVITLAKSDKYAAIADYLLNNDKFMSTVGKQNPAIAGLKEYMDNRAYLVAELDKARAATGDKTINAKSLRVYGLVRDELITTLSQKYPQSAQILTRYFANDELNSIDSQLVSVK